MRQLELFPLDGDGQALVPLYHQHEPTMPVVFSRLATLEQSQQNAACFESMSLCQGYTQNQLAQLASQQMNAAGQAMPGQALRMTALDLALAMRQLRSVYTEAEKQGSYVQIQSSSYRWDLGKPLAYILLIASLVVLGCLILPLVS